MTTDTTAGALEEAPAPAAAIMARVGDLLEELRALSESRGQEEGRAHDWLNDSATVNLPRLPGALGDLDAAGGLAAILFGTEIAPLGTDGAEERTAFQIARVYLESLDGPGRELMQACAVAVAQDNARRAQESEGTE